MVKKELLEGHLLHRLMRTLQRGVKGEEAGVRYSYTGIESKLHLKVVAGEGEATVTPMVTLAPTHSHQLTHTISPHSRSL